MSDGAHYLADGTAILAADRAGRTFYDQLDVSEPLRVIEEAGAFNFRPGFGAATGALFIVSFLSLRPQAARQVSKHNRPDGTLNTNGYDAEYGVLPDGRSIIDLSFAAHFAPAVAAHVANFMVEQGAMSPERRASLTLSEWADMIASPWFSGIIHDLAFTRNGAWERFGKHPDDYFRGNLALRIKGRIHSRYEEYDGPIFEMHEVTGGGGAKDVVVGTSAGVRHWLRRVTSGGCPAARKGGTIDTDDAFVREHLEVLRTAGILTLDPARGNRTRAVFHMQHTAIDRALQVIANHFRRYDHAFGTPFYDEATQTFNHQLAPTEYGTRIARFLGGLLNRGR